MWQLLKATTLEVIKAISPLIVIIIILQFFLVKAPGSVFLQFLISTVMIIAGMTLFLLGIEIGILPAGKTVGAGLMGRRSLWLVIAVAFLIGFSVTIAEPDVIVLSGQAGEISQGSIPGTSLLYIIGIGVGIFTVLAMLRIIVGFPLTYLFAICYAVIIVMAFFTPPDYVSLAFDAGSATTGALTAPIVLSLGLGLSSVLAGRSAIKDGFGLLGLASIGPIIAVMIMGIILR